MTSTPFKFQVSDGDLDQLRQRVRLTRWATTIGVTGWEGGTHPDELRRLADYWADEFDWRRQEAVINAFPSHLATVSGTAIHYLRFDAETDDAIPLILTHGWPSTFLELTELALRLSRPSEYDRPTADAFTVIVPSLPGFVFSQQSPGLPSEIPTHELWHQLMHSELGFERYGAHGGDLGAGVTSRMGQSHPDEVIGIHILAVAPPANYDPATLDDEERTFLESVERWTGSEGGYQHVQQTRPMSLAPALADSPVGLLAWIVEKYRAWSDSHGDLSSRFDDDFILTQVSLYWFTNTISTSFKPYFEYGQGFSGPVGDVTVPTAIALFPADLTHPPRRWAERSYKVHRFTTMPQGGHFAAHEEPGLLADDIHAFFHSLTPTT